ncbi:MAG: hypothetical protein IT230_03580 [Flavobacteriales bacterium]|nr:hypothetical protein [Flavobacteriales bacterium]
MQLPSLLIATVLLATVAGCKGKQELSDAQAPASTAPSAAGHTNAPAPPAAAQEPEPDQVAAAMPKLGGDSVFFAMERTACYGTCPAYRLVIDQQGRATYEGRRFAPREGRFTAQVDAATMDALKNEVEGMGFYDLQDVYDQPVTDLPSVIIRLRTGAHDKQVLGRVGAPKAFKDLAVRVEELLAPVAWTPVADGR